MTTWYWPLSIPDSNPFDRTRVFRSCSNVFAPERHRPCVGSRLVQVRENVTAHGRGSDCARRVRCPQLGTMRLHTTDLAWLVSDKNLPFFVLDQRTRLAPVIDQETPQT